MKPSVSSAALVAILSMVLVRPAAAQRGFPWWKDDKVVKELGLTPDQSARIDNIFRATIPQLRQEKEELDRQEAELSRLIAVNADEVLVTRQIDRVESVRANLNKTRMLMLLHMVRKLSPEQRAKFTPVHEQWRRDNPPTPGPAEANRPADANRPPESPRPADPARPPDPKGRPQAR
jgi:Spy/CpxP family protein refolding chaperone